VCVCVCAMVGAGVQFVIFGARRKLGALLSASEDPVTLAVVCFDIGEFARFHPHGKGYAPAFCAHVRRGR
jgi:hypothetical protein